MLVSTTTGLRSMSGGGDITTIWALSEMAELATAKAMVAERDFWCMGRIRDASDEREWDRGARKLRRKVGMIKWVKVRPGHLTAWRKQPKPLGSEVSSPGRGRSCACLRSRPDFDLALRDHIAAGSANSIGPRRRAPRAIPRSQPQVERHGAERHVLAADRRDRTTVDVGHGLHLGREQSALHRSQGQRRALRAVDPGQESALRRAIHEELEHPDG